MAVSKKKVANYFKNFRNSSIRHTIWPIRSFELFKFTPMALLMFCILLNQNVVRSLKDSLVMTLVGPEVISFIKLWGEMPLGILFVIFYSSLCNKMSTERAFRVIVSSFLVFYAIFAFILYPYKDFFHPNPETVNLLVNQHPHFKWFIIMWGKWSFILIYIMGELWPVILFSLLFWQLANKITKTEEASRFYPFFSIFGQANCLIAGSVVIYFSSNNHFLIPFFNHLSDKTEIMIKSLTVIVIISGIISIYIQKYIEKTIVNKMDCQKKIEPADCTEQVKLGVLSSLKLILSSKYLYYIALMLISYSFAMNLLEGILMFKAKEIYPTASLFIAYQGRVLFWTGVVTITCALIGSTLIRKFGWIWAAILTPVVMLISGTVFYLAILVQNDLNDLEIFDYYLTPIMIIVFIGAIQLILSRGLKYSLFDATKEMAYIPLHDEIKTKAKAATDIIGTKIGKSIGAVIQISLFSIFPTINYNDIAGVLMSFFIFICIIWIFAVIKLSKEYNTKINLLNFIDK